MVELPCDGDTVCMVCKTIPSPEDILTCHTCATPWHLTCLISSRPQSMSLAFHWDCPDCSAPLSPPPSHCSSHLIAAIRAIEMDHSFTALEKAVKRQELLLSGSRVAVATSSSELVVVRSFPNQIIRIDGGDDDDLMDGRLNCSFCMQLPDRPVTTPCGHNFCLKCFKKWIALGKRTCTNCRSRIPPDMATHPRINLALVIAIRTAKMSKSIAAGGPAKVYHFVDNFNRPDKAYTTEQAKRSGKANACSGKIFVTVPPDYFGPILAQNDPVRKQGVLVGETWEDRRECRQWGVHLPHIAGIAGQSSHGAQSVALSGGYSDDEDHGEWFLYTGSGGKDLSGNKRMNKTQSFDQQFRKSNQALRISCQKGYPVRVVRSYKRKCSLYSPKRGLRYDGIYRIDKCWRKIGTQGHKVCRYLFVRCDNEPAPWTSDNHGDHPRPLPVIDELKKAIDITERSESPSWDYDEEKCCWMWKKPPPHSRKQVDGENPDGKRMKRRKREKLLKEISCQICQKMMTQPLTTPCGHNFCKACLEGLFAGQSYIRQTACQSTRTLRVQINVMKCPSCTNNIANFLQNPRVNRELMCVIGSLHQRLAEMGDSEDYCDKRSGAQEKVDTVADTEISKVNSTQSPEEAKDKILRRQMEKQPLQTYKRKKEVSGHGMSSTGGQKAGGKSSQLVDTAIVNVDTAKAEESNLNSQSPEEAKDNILRHQIERKPLQTYKRKRIGGSHLM